VCGVCVCGVCVCVCVCVGPPAWNILAATGRIFVKFCIWYLYENHSTLSDFD